MEEKAQFSTMFVFVIIAGIFLFIGLLAVPVLLNLGTGLFAGSETIMEQTLESANEINDPAVKAAVTNSIQSSKDSFVGQTEIWNIFVSFIVLIIIAITGLVVYLNGRTNVERQIG
jgi:hypothetical protein